MSLMLAALLLPPIVAPAGPTEVSARSFLQTIYAYYRKGGTGVPLKRPERWFEPRVAAGIRADMAESNRTGDIGKLDADLFCNCQDFDDITAAIARSRSPATRRPPLSPSSTAGKCRCATR